MSGPGPVTSRSSGPEVPFRALYDTLLVMRKWLLPLCLAGLMLAGSCTTDNDPGDSSSGTDAPAFVGLKENAARSLAKQKGLEVRLCQVGEDCILTMDLRRDRVNLFLEDGRVRSARIY